jgi:hypothetical protein
VNLQRQFIKNATAYYVRHGCSESEARRHATADAKWWRSELRKILGLDENKLK